MKVRKILRTIMIFVVAMILICLLLSIILSAVTDNSEGILNTTLNYLLYIIGYGSLIHDSLLVQDLFGVFGIVTISILSAYTTVNLFWRVDDVLVSNNMIIWKNPKNKYYASVLIGNKGKNICKLELSIIAYDERKNPIGDLGKTFTYPLLIKNGIWKIDFPIEGGFLFDVLRTIRKERKDCRLYATFEYVDSETGQSSIIVKEYSTESIYVSSAREGFYSSDVDKKLRWKQFKNIDKFLQKDIIFNDWICRNIVSFDLSKAKPINKEQIKLGCAELEGKTCVLQADVDFGDTNNKPDFVMALLDFNNPYQDWSSYLSRESDFQIEISGDDGIPEIQLEIKDKSGDKLIDEKISVTQNITMHSFKLNKSNDTNPECFSEIKEICFTVFSTPSNLVKGRFNIHSCQILIGDKGKICAEGIEL